MKRPGFKIFAALSVSFAVLAVPASAETPQKPEPTIDERIAFDKQKLAEHPTLYIVYTQLAAAYLDKAREALDPQWLKLAEDSLQKSLKIYANFDAYKGLLILNAYRHRFADARHWGEIAHPMFLDDHEVVAVQVEADLGLGDIESARKRLSHFGPQPDFFHLAASWANIFKAEGKYDEARQMFLRAETLARDQGFTQLAMWARTNAGGMLIDSGRARQARADLEAATQIRKGDPILRLHWAEYHEAMGQPEKALNIVESMIADAPNPSYYTRAYRLEKLVGNFKKADEYYAAAEKGYLTPLAAGEIYSLGSLAELYCAADRHLDTALEYAQRNLQYKRDPEALQALKCVQDKIASHKTIQPAPAAASGAPARAG